MSDHWLEHEWLAMRRRMLACIAAGRSEMAPEPLRLDTGAYTDPRRFEAERRELFARTPLLAGFSCELPEPGSVITFDAFGPPVFVLRRADGSLGAWLNRCPHRGARLVDGPGLRRNGVVCPFHAWRFDEHGTLADRPLGEAFGCPADALVPVPVAEVHGLVFLRQDPRGEPIDVDGFLGPMLPLVRSFGLERTGHVATEAVQVRANWKLVVDVSCEGYHVPATHPRTLSPQLVPFLTIHDSFGRHHRFASPSRALKALADTPEAEWPPSGYSAVHYLFPNTILTYSDAIDGALPVFAVNRSFPGETPGETTVVYSTYRPAGATQPPEAFEALHAAVVGINRAEDLPMVERAWENYRREPRPLPLEFGRNEMILQRYHADVAAAIGMPLPGSTAPR